MREVAADAFHERGNLARLRLELPESAPGWAEIYFPELQGYYRNGMRKQYLDCIRTSRDGVFDFLTYDSLFPSIQEFKDQVLIAPDRLKSSAHLAPLYRDAYLDWLRKNAAGAVQIAIESDNLAGLKTLFLFPKGAARFLFRPFLDLPPVVLAVVRPAGRLLQVVGRGPPLFPARLLHKVVARAAIPFSSDCRRSALQ